MFDCIIASRLIALDKCHSNWEVIRRIIGKLFLPSFEQTYKKLQEICNYVLVSKQLVKPQLIQCAYDLETEAAILVDVTNTFNNFNCQFAPIKITLSCPPFAKVIVNTYHENSFKFIGETILSKDVTTQDDPLAMAIYTIGIILLIRKL